MAKHVEDKLFKITTITALEKAYRVLCTTSLSREQLIDRSECGFSPCVW